jgi:hypothetical protein
MKTAMDTKAKLLLGAAAAALLSGPSLAAPPEAQGRPNLIAASYSELLEPIPNAVEQLRATDADSAAEAPELIPIQYINHHHHHHNRAWYLQNGYFWNGGRWVLRPVAHHHHHHNRAWYRRNGYYWNGGAWVLRPVAHHHHHQNPY